MSKLPHITSSATFISEYTFTDTLSKGITYNQDVKIAFYSAKEDADTNIYVHLPLGSDTGAGYQAAFSFGEIRENLTETIRMRCGADISEYLEELDILRIEKEY